MSDLTQIGWARERWTANFWRNTIPMLAENEILVKGGKLWLPNLDCVQCSIDDFRAEIEKYYVIEAVEDPNLNPLYAATENVETELLRCPDHLTNETQLRPLLIYSKTPFLTLSRREVPLATCVTPSGRAISRLSVDHKIVPTNLSKTNLELASAPVRNTLSKSKSKQLKSPSKRKTSVSQEVKIEEEEASAPPMSPTKRRIASVVTPPRIKAPVQ